MSRDNTYILLFADRFSRRADTFAVTAAAITSEGTANVLVNQHIPLCGYPRSIRSDNGFQVCLKLSHVVYNLFGVRKIITSSCHPTTTVGWSV